MSKKISIYYIEDVIDEFKAFSKYLRKADFDLFPSSIDNWNEDRTVIRNYIQNSNKKHLEYLENLLINDYDLIIIDVSLYGNQSGGKVILNELYRNSKFKNVKFIILAGVVPPSLPEHSNRFRVVDKFQNGNSVDYETTVSVLNMVINDMFDIVSSNDDLNPSLLTARKLFD